MLGKTQLQPAKPLLQGTYSSWHKFEKVESYLFSIPVLDMPLNHRAQVAHFQQKIFVILASAQFLLIVAYWGASQGE